MNKKQELSKKYDCDGNCYTSNSMCSRAEHCPETKMREFWTTIIASLVVSIFPIAIIVSIVYMAFNCI